MLAAIEALGYMPSRIKAIGVRIVTPSLEVQSQSDSMGYLPGKTGRLLVGLLVPEGGRLGGEGRQATTIKVTAPEGLAFEETERRITEALSEPKRVFELRFKVDAGAKAGERKVQVEVGFQGDDGQVQKLTIEVPVEVDAPQGGG